MNIQKISLFFVIIIGISSGVAINFFEYSQNNSQILEANNLILLHTIQSNEGARCDNMSLGDKCNASSAGCGPGESGTGYDLSCSISCFNGSTVNCGEADTDPGESGWLKDIFFKHFEINSAQEPCTKLG